MFNININFWVILGLFGQFIFFLRFFIQWIHSEKNKKSMIPFSFWYFSIGGAIILLIYAVHIRDLVFSLGQGLALLIYIRNIMLYKKDEE
ncbi:MAG: lipid-A-disaccharide synthase N-terminal domain-containing protein [Patescibacteria group bacterium]|jgi:lipid-A-disaccharide synthase-like uncharacterized protein